MYLSSDFFARAPEIVAPEFVGSVISLHGKRLSITEVEAYGGCDDPASHAFRGPSVRNAAMFGEPGSLYVYLSYGVHFCLNVVAHEPEVAGALLVRAGIDLFVPKGDPRRIVVGPGRIGRFFDVTRAESGLRLEMGASSSLSARLRDLAYERDLEMTGAIATGPRVGISRAIDRPWRFWLSGSEAVSPYRTLRKRLVE